MCHKTWPPDQLHDEALNPERLYIYLHTSRLSSVRLRRPDGIPAVAALPARLQAPLLPEALLLQLLVQDTRRIFSQRVSRWRGQVLPDADHLWVPVALRLHDQLHWAG